MTDIVMIPLSKLVPGRKNVRKTKPTLSIAELAASIAAVGLLQNLVVAESENGRYSVEAGGRRLKALKKLTKAKAIPGNHPVPCRIVPIDDATEASLAENVQREPMHPADEIEAFAQLAEAGQGPETIAGRFGVSGVHVARRLKLARVSPRLIEALKKDEIDLDQLGALAFTDDHALQERAFFDSPDWQRSPDQLRARVTQAHVAETDKLVRFVGVEAYQAEGGTLASDLFAHEEETRWLADREILVRLAEAKLAAIVEDVRGEGWGWVEIAIDGVAWNQFPQRVREARRQLAADEQAEQERLYARLDETDDEAEIEKIEAAIDALAPSAWNLEEVALAGAVITLSHTGEPKVERGLVRSDDAKALKTLQRKAAKAEVADTGNGGDDSGGDGDEGGAPAIGPKSPIPAKLLDELTAHKTLALRVAVAQKPDLALRLLVLGLASNALNHDYNVFSLVAVRVDEADAGKRIVCSESTAPSALAKLREAWTQRLPGSTDALWAFLSTADQQTLLDLLAVLVAPALELRSGRAAAVSEAICEAAGLDITQWWSASVESYFDHVRKSVIVDALMEINPKFDRAQLERATKKEVLGRAKRAFKKSTWLPEPLRTSNAAKEPSEAVVPIAAE